MANDSIGFDAGPLEEIAESAMTSKESLDSFIEQIKKDLDDISKNWEGEIKESALVDFKKAETAMNSISSNAGTIAKIISDKANKFGQVKY